MVMLEWGSCGQMAVSAATAEAGDPTPSRRRAVPGLRVLRAAARRAPGAAVSRPDRSAPTRCCSPRSGSSPGRPTDLPRPLIAAVVSDLVRRGVRALEAFGRTAEAAELTGPATVSRGCRARDRRRSATARSTSACSTPTSCWTPASWWCRTAPYFPRLRLELEQGPRLEGRASRRRWSGCWRARSCEQPVGAGSNSVPVQTAGAACSTDSSWASSSAKVKVPVGRSFLPSRYSRLTAARMPSAIESRDCRRHQGGAVARVGDVADVDLHGGHPGQPQQIPGSAVRPAVT